MRTLKSLSLVLGAGLALISLTGCAKLQSRDQMNQGVQAYKSNHYADAVKHFKEAVRLDPSNQNAQLYLGTSYYVQWVPGAETPDNKKNYDMARQTFEEVLKKDPANSLALATMASIAYNSASTGTQDQKAAALEEARKWNIRRTEVDPKDAEAYYYLGVINWAEAFTPIRDARAEAKMNPNEPGPMKDPKIKGELQGKYGKMIDEGLEYLKKSLAIDKENEDAMSYMNLLLRERAVLQESPEAAKADIAQAEDWSNKSLDMRKIKANRPAKKTEAS